MKKTVKISIKLICLALAAIMVFPLASCSKDLFEGVESTEEELRAVGTVADYDVLYDELYYLIMSCKDMMKNKYGEDIWKDEASGAEYGDELRKMVLERITANYAVLTLCEEYGYKNALEKSDVVEYVNDEIDNMICALAMQNGIKVELGESLTGKLTYKYEEGGRAKAYEIFKEALVLTYLNERVMRLTLGTEFAFGELTDILTGKKEEIIYKEADIEAFMFSDKFICTRHILIQNDKGDDIAANRALAEEAYQKYLSGESMDKLIGSKYNEDVTMAPTVGYYFTYGEMDEAYEKAAFALKVGEVSGIVETDDGFFIIERREKSSTYMLGNFEPLAQQITYALVNQKLTDRQKELSLEMNDFGRSLDFVKIAVEGEKKMDELLSKSEETK
ncbi:MAG: peptidylprolyl isomerase [Clostridia bacterium]|nr:peptidylprolyl isomerase [Clostridia bacterium]